MDSKKETIMVSEIAMKENNIKLKDQRGRTFTIFEKKQNGEETVAHNQYNSLGIKIGSCIEILFNEKPTGEGTGMYRTINYLKVGSPQNEALNQPTESNLSGFKQSKVSDSQNGSQEQIGRKVEQNIRWCNALNNACLLVANGKSVSPYPDESAKGGELYKLINIANFIYKLEPEKDLKEKIADHPSLGSNIRKEENIPVEEVPFD